jgi:glycyl-tRNA synthetase
LFKVSRGRFPFAIAQVGKSFRNEISPRQSLFRLREFYQAEIEVFCNPKNLNNLTRFDEVKNTNLILHIDSRIYELTAEDALRKDLLPNKLIAYYLSLLTLFYEKTGINMKKTRFRKLRDNEKAFYASIAFDFEVQTGLGWSELVACNYRADYDLKQHSFISKENMYVIDPESQEKILPHVFELSMGIDRSLYTILEHSFFADKENKRRVLKLKPYLSPITIGVLPLIKHREIEELAKKNYKELIKNFDVYYDSSGSIGRRYRRLEEIGVPFVITVDHMSLVDNTVTMRYRDSMKQERIKIEEIKNFLYENLYVSL